ncbi:hypothetical protein [Dysgonomonas sp. 511]|uniref:hypothetical protein n=1 Tax=Dysgonomonas sp. 511 TaxID=2302930 RepID=UPI0013D59143|nr:hypothetical protein [Dysgonomonas sp. 511]NDV79257.1 hypothetical protein [Dysgonomonas sp. 511]
MNKLTFTLVFLFLSLPLFSQDYTLPDIQGLRDRRGGVVLEAGGYEIIISGMKGNMDDDKVLAQLKKKYNIKDVLANYSDSTLDVPNKAFEAIARREDRPNTTFNMKGYLISEPEKGITTIIFQTLNQRNPQLEQAIVQIYLDGKIDDYITDLRADSIQFAGRTIHLGNACLWRSAHNVYCMGGQISWSEHTSFEAANQDINNRIAANADGKDVVVLDEGPLDIMFEGIPSLAYRVAYQQEEKYEIAASAARSLIVYYIVQEVRGRYMSCVLSNYGYNRNDYRLSPLLQQVMSIPQLPESAHNAFDIPEYEQLETIGNRNAGFTLLTEEEEAESKLLINIWEVRVGTSLPLGKLNKIFEVAPTVGFFVGVPFNNATMAFDIGLQMTFPVSSKPFDYYRHDEFYDVAKARAIFGMNLRWRYQKMLAPDVFLTPYLTFGFNGLRTNLRKEGDDEEESPFYFVETFGVYGGAVLRYKKVGCFAEYQYSPYSIGNKVKSSFGNSAVNVGLSFCF